MTPRMQGRFHIAMAIFWILFLIPTYLWWRDNVFLVLIVSFWANSFTHVGAYQATRAEMAASKDSQ